ncbi:DUF2391 family protein [Thermovibrio sp.]
MDRERLERIERELRTIEEKVSSIDERLQKNRSFSFADLIQEVAGATLLAFPFAANSDIWELSEKISVAHALFILLLVATSLFFVIEYSGIGDFKVQHLGGFLPLRLLTILTVSLFVSALSLLILGVYPSIIGNLKWLFKATVLITLFSVIGSFGLDAAK